MKATQYYVGDVPALPISIDVRNKTGLTSLNSWTDFELKMLGSDNEEIDLSGGRLVTEGAGQGSFVFHWPAKSVFTKTGEYVLQLVMTNEDGRRDSTSFHTIKVSKLGRLNK